MGTGRQGINQPEPRTISGGRPYGTTGVETICRGNLDVNCRPLEASAVKDGWEISLVDGETEIRETSDNGSIERETLSSPRIQ